MPKYCDNKHHSKDGCEFCIAFLQSELHRLLEKRIKGSFSTRDSFLARIEKIGNTPVRKLGAPLFPSQEKIEEALEGLDRIKQSIKLTERTLLFIKEVLEKEGEESP